MNWKLLLISLSLVVGILARPADEIPTVVSDETTTAKVAETTNLTEKPSTEALIATTTATSTKHKIPDAPTPTRYLHQINLNQKTKPTNSRSKYANNYANLITKHTLNKQKFVNNTIGGSSAGGNLTLDNLSFNISWGGSNNNHKNVTPTISSSTPSIEPSSNSSSRPLVFVDADVTTTKRAFVQLLGSPNHGTWSNYNLEDVGSVPTVKKKPVIHKIISKWSDNPHDVFNLHAAANQDPFINSQQAQITALTNQLVQNAFNNRIPTTNTDNLPITVGQQMLHELQHMSSTRKPVVKSSSSKPIVVSSTVNNLVMDVKKPSTTPSYSKDKCLIKIGNKVITNYDECKKYFVDNKVDSTKFNDYDDTPVGFQIEEEPDFPSPGGGGIPQPPSGEFPSGEIPSARPSGVAPTGGGGNSDKEKNKRKNKIKNKNKNKDDTDIGSMVMTMMTMMAVFNPLNFGVWGIVMAPMAAMLLGGACFAMYHYMNYQTKPVWHPPQHHHHGWNHPQEVIIRNKINHSAIPIKVTHLHKHIKQLSAPVHEYSPAHHEVHEYSPPWEVPEKTFGEPPSDYFPSAPMGGPYRRKTSMRKRVQKTSPFRFKLL
jgi:hypothetical protein